MPKYIELSAHVNISSSASVKGTILGSKKLKPFMENGEFQGYVITSPATGREILIGKENTFNGDLDLPSFKDSFTAYAIPEKGYPEEHLGIMFGQVIYFRPIGDNQAEIIGQMPMVDCTWEPDKDIGKGNG